ncbi:unnamed protein product [Prorocentrum cordatum]|uniref:Mei2-like C-terminal RNA recognition motif domain-containing protein n=1 Tax=Prorocentrum cordatum TaxID=2364126 RepID=A0ABN9WLA5_9DINO|nr:unnamed protein product [Polarella glacialis]
MWAQGVELSSSPRGIVAALSSAIFSAEPEAAAAFAMTLATGRGLQQFARDGGNEGPPAQDAAKLSQQPDARGGAAVQSAHCGAIGAHLHWSLAHAGPSTGQCGRMAGVCPEESGAAWPSQPPGAQPQEQLEAEEARRLCRSSPGSVRTTGDGHGAPGGHPMDRKTFSSWSSDAALVIKNTFYHSKEADDDLGEALRRTRSSPTLTPAPPRHGPAAASGRGPPRAAGRGPGPPEAPGAGEWRTSVLLRNVPYLLSRGALLDLLSSQGFGGEYDLVYLPRDFATRQTLGYAIVNALTPSAALRLRAAFDGFQAWPVKSSKVCTVGWCDRQGLSKNIKFFRNSRVVMGNLPDEFKPALFSQGSQIQFPHPTRKLVKILKREH